MVTDTAVATIEVLLEQGGGGSFDGAKVHEVHTGGGREKEVVQQSAAGAGRGSRIRVARLHSRSAEVTGRHSRDSTARYGRPRERWWGEQGVKAKDVSKRAHQGRVLVSIVEITADNEAPVLTVAGIEKRLSEEVIARARRLRAGDVHGSHPPGANSSDDEVVPGAGGLVSERQLPATSGKQVLTTQDQEAATPMPFDRMGDRQHLPGRGQAQVSEDILRVPSLLAKENIDAMQG
jgi:hypothetical protein